MEHILLVLAFTLPGTALAQVSQTLVPIDAQIADAFAQLRANTVVQSALQTIFDLEPEAISEQIRLTEIPAPRRLFPGTDAPTRPP